MNKKLFLVLVLVTSVLVAGSLVIAGKSGVFKGPSGVVVEPQQPQLAPTLPKFPQSRIATPLPPSAIPAPQSPTPLPPKPPDHKTQKPPITRPSPTIPVSGMSQTPVAQPTPSSHLSSKEKYAPGELLVKFKPATTSDKKEIGFKQLPRPSDLSTLAILSPTQDTILYDNNTPLCLDTNSNAWTGVRFTPLTNFELKAIYFTILNQYDNSTDGCSLYVVEDDGRGFPIWPFAVLASLWVPPPLPDMIWMQIDLSCPIRFLANEDFHVIYGPAPGGPYPGPGWWNLLDSDGTTTQRSHISFDNRETWLTATFADAFVRAGGEYSEHPFQITGQVLDATDNPLSMVTVELIDTTTSTFTDSCGGFTLPVPDTGTYRVKCSKTGYVSTSRLSWVGSSPGFDFSDPLIRMVELAAPVDIGPDGGTIVGPDSETLVIPPGALDEVTPISFTPIRADFTHDAPTMTSFSHNTLRPKGFQLEPAGVSLNVPATITFPLPVPRTEGIYDFLSGNDLNVRFIDSTTLDVTPESLAVTVDTVNWTGSYSITHFGYQIIYDGYGFPEPFVAQVPEWYIGTCLCASEPKKVTLENWPKTCNCQEAFCKAPDVEFTFSQTNAFEITVGVAATFGISGEVGNALLGKLSAQYSMTFSAEVKRTWTNSFGRTVTFEGATYQGPWKGEAITRIYAKEVTYTYMDVKYNQPPDTLGQFKVRYDIGAEDVPPERCIRAVQVTAPAGKFGPPGQIITYTFKVKNTGDLTTTYRLTLTSSWPSSIVGGIDEITLDPGGERDVWVTHTIPSDAQPGQSDELTLKAESIPPKDSHSPPVADEGSSMARSIHPFTEMDTTVWDEDFVTTTVVAAGCCQFPYYCDMITEDSCINAGGTWFPPPSLCIEDSCQYAPMPCDLIQDNGAAQGYASWIWEGFQIAKWYNPEDYCEPPVYPYKISDVEFPLYKWGAAAPQANVQIAIYLECQDSCDGPGTQIYLSDIYNITSFFPNWSHIDLPEPVCVYEPFFIAIRWAAGPTPMPSFLMDNNFGMPGDSCHVWYYDPDVPAWYEHHDWWGSPENVGMAMIRVSGYTNSPDCNFAPCDTTLTTLAGGNIAYYFKTPPNDAFLNMRFELPATYGGKLDHFRMTFYKAGTFGTPDVDYYVWLSDGIFPLDNNPPYGAVASFHVPYADIQWYSAYDTLYTYSYNLIFEAGESFHIGWTHAFDPGDTLSPLGDTSSVGGHRSSGWDGTAWEDMFNYRFKIDAYVCPIIPEESTFTMKCTPSSYSCNPYDPPTNLFKVALTPIRGYSLPVTFSLTNVQPPAGITAVFTPGSGSPPCTSDVEITITDPTLAYDDYNLTFQGVGSDGQTRTANAVLTVWDEDTISFYHGKQRVSDFGAVANDDAKNENFVWYTQKPLYDGGFVIATDGDHVALDVYDCKHYGWAPPVVGGLQEHMTITYDPVYNVNMAAGHYCCDEALTGVPGVPGECDSVFFIGIMDPPVDFSVKIKIYYNAGTEPITNMYAGVYEDWDVSSGGATDWGDMDTLHNIIWQYANAADYLVFGLMKAPFYDEPMHSMIAIHNPTEVYPTGDSSINCGNDPGLPYLYRLMSTHQYRNYGYWTGSPDDHSMLIAAPPFSLNPGEKHIEIWINFGRNTAEDGLDSSQWYHKVLRYVGFYRGDINADDIVNVTDVVYMINYLFIHGPAPKPYTDQGDVNADGEVNVSDVVYLINYFFIHGPTPIDYVRFIPQKWTRPSLFENPNWR